MAAAPVRRAPPRAPGAGQPPPRPALARPALPRRAATAAASAQDGPLADRVQRAAVQMASALFGALAPAAPAAPGLPPGMGRRLCLYLRVLLSAAAIRLCMKRRGWHASGPAGDVALEFIRNPLRFLDTTAAEYGGAAAFTLGGQRVVLITEPGLARDILIGQSSSFQKVGLKASLSHTYISANVPRAPHASPFPHLRCIVGVLHLWSCGQQKGTAFFPGSRLAGNGLLVSDGDVWRRQRQLSTPAFRQQAVNTYTKAGECYACCVSIVRWTAIPS